MFEEVYPSLMFWRYEEEPRPSSSSLIFHLFLLFQTLPRLYSEKRRPGRGASGSRGDVMEIQDSLNNKSFERGQRRVHTRETLQEENTPTHKGLKCP